MSTESRRGETGIGKGLVVIAALIAVTLTASAPAAAQSRDGSANEGTLDTSAESQYGPRGSPDCQPGQCPPVTADGSPSLADVPGEAGSSGSKSFRGFSQSLGGDGSTGIPPAAADENTGTSGPGSDMGSDEPAGDAGSEAGASSTDGAKPKKNAGPGALLTADSISGFALGVVFLAACGLLIRRIVR